jgi:hypothetical protein
MEQGDSTDDKDCSQSAWPYPADHDAKPLPDLSTTKPEGVRKFRERYAPFSYVRHIVVRLPA